MVAGTIIMLRLFIVQLPSMVVRSVGQHQHDLFGELFPERGDILVHDRYKVPALFVATNKIYYEVCRTSPYYRSSSYAQALAPLLTIPKDELLQKIDKPGVDEI